MLKLRFVLLWDTHPMDLRFPAWVECRLVQSDFSANIGLFSNESGFDFSLYQLVWWLGKGRQ